MRTSKPRKSFFIETDIPTYTKISTVFGFTKKPSDLTLYPHSFPAATELSLICGIPKEGWQYSEVTLGDGKLGWFRGLVRSRSIFFGGHWFSGQEALLAASRCVSLLISWYLGRYHIFLLSSRVCPFPFYPQKEHLFLGMNWHGSKDNSNISILGIPDCWQSPSNCSFSTDVPQRSCLDGVERTLEDLRSSVSLISVW